MTLTNARTKVWTEPKGPDQKRADLRFMEVSGQVASFVDFFGDVLGTFLFCWEGVILQSLKLRAFFWGLAPPSLGVIFFGDCMHPMSFLGIVVREVSIGKLLRIGNHPQNGNATHAVTLGFGSKSVWTSLVKSLGCCNRYHVHRVEGCRPWIKAKPWKLETNIWVLNQN